MPATEVRETERASGDLSEHAIAAILEDRIESGIYEPGSRLPSERDLALEFGVSRRFVRMASALLIERGLMEKSHYRRPFVALENDRKRDTASIDPGIAATSANQTIAAVLPSHPAFPGGLSMVAGIHKVLAYSGSPCRLTFIDTFHKDRPEVLRIETNAIRSLTQSGVSGLIWWSYSDDDQIAATIRANPGVPIVFIDRHPSDRDCDFVGIDDVESSRMAVEHLIDLGHTRIAHLMDPGNYSTILARAEGWRQAHAAREIPCTDDMIFHLGWSEDRVQLAFDHWYSLPDPPTALFTSNDFIAHEFINYAETRGIRVPDDLSVIGHGNIDRYSPREFLTSVDQPFEQIGKAAARLMLKRLAQGEATQSYQQIIMPATLIERSSCRALRG